MQTLNSNQAPQIDLSKTTVVNTPDGGVLFQQGIILRKASKFLTNSKEDMILPIMVFFDPKTGKIIEDTVPQELRTELKDFIFGK